MYPQWTVHIVLIARGPAGPIVVVYCRRNQEPACRHLHTLACSYIAQPATARTPRDDLPTGSAYTYGYLVPHQQARRLQTYPPRSQSHYPGLPLVEGRRTWYSRLVDTDRRVESAYLSARTFEYPRGSGRVPECD